MKAFTSGCAGTSLNADERAFFAAEQPWGLIVFGRNVESLGQLQALTNEFRRAVDDEHRPVLIDQEGGRVQRMVPPLAPRYPSNAEIARDYGKHPEQVRRAVWLLGRLHAFDLERVGIDIDCLPVLDVRAANADPVIGDRAFGHDPQSVADLGRAACEGLLSGGVLPVIKHMPGHGRADADSHKALPVVSASAEALRTHDFPPFASLSNMPLGMSAHVVFTAFDPNRPATTSSTVIETVVRGELGFDGLLMSDDISMHALQGPFEDRTRDLLGAGCDIALHCNGMMDEMRAVASAAVELHGRSLARSDKALAMRQMRDDTDEAAARGEFRDLTGVDVSRAVA